MYIVNHSPPIFLDCENSKLIKNTELRALLSILLILQPISI